MTRQQHADRAQKKHALQGTEPRAKKKGKHGGGTERAAPTCGYCREPGHTKRTCPVKKSDELDRERLTRITMRSDEMRRLLHGGDEEEDEEEEGTKARRNTNETANGKRKGKPAHPKKSRK